MITNKASVSDYINPNDEYYTPNYAITPLLKYLKPNSHICCPFDTEQSNFVNVLIANGHKVTFSHVSTGIDFFNIDFSIYDAVISNPPYSLKNEVLEKLFASGTPFAMLVGVVGLFESKKRFHLFKNNSFEIMYFNRRIAYFKDYNEQKPSIKPPFSSVYISRGLLPSRIVFEVLPMSNAKTIQLDISKQAA